MANNLKELLNRPLPRDDKNRASLFAVISGYLLYMAWEVLRDTANGVSSMSVEASVACAAFLALGGLGTLAQSLSRAPPDIRNCSSSSVFRFTSIRHT